MSGRLEGKTAIVTGSTKGIGLGIARAYVREGARVVINSRSAEDGAGIVREPGPSAGPYPRTFPAPGRFAASPSRREPRWAAWTFSSTTRDYRYTLDLNLNGCFALTRARAGDAGSPPQLHHPRQQPERQRALPAAPGLLRLQGRAQHDDQGHGHRVGSEGRASQRNRARLRAAEFITTLSARGVLDAERLARRTLMGRIGDT